MEPLLEPQAVARVDRACLTSGIESFGLMKAAGYSVAAEALRRFPSARRFVILAGPGNNGGDGYVAGKALEESGADTILFQLATERPSGGDAARAYDQYDKRGDELALYQPMTGDVVIDALFGAGLSRDLPDEACEVIRRVSEARVPVVAVDIPSGICGHSGQVRGAAFSAVVTVTFAARKPGQLLLPGREYCGTVVLADIGIPQRFTRKERSATVANAPLIWKTFAGGRTAGSHKFSQGSVVVFSGEATHGGAARLSALSALRAGAGLVTVASPSSALGEHAAHLDAVMVKEIDKPEDVVAVLLSDPRINAFVLGPGFGVGEKARQFALSLAGRMVVLDADGITSFRDVPHILFEAYSGNCRLILTPHAGEFARLFPDIAADMAISKVDRALAAAKRSNAVVVYKGADTVIAAPDGRSAINENAPPWLATAGSGDVLAGICGGLLAQGYPPYEAACAAVWKHGAAGTCAGKTLTADTLINFIDT